MEFRRWPSENGSVAQVDSHSCSCSGLETAKRLIQCFRLAAEIGERCREVPEVVASSLDVAADKWLEDPDADVSELLDLVSEIDRVNLETTEALRAAGVLSSSSLEREDALFARGKKLVAEARAK